LFDPESPEDSPINTLGAGSFGKVYHVMDSVGNGECALKRISMKHSDFFDELVKESNLLSKMSAPNIVRYFDSFISEGHFFLKMEYVSGRTLSDIIWQFETIEESTVMYWLKGLLAGLSYIHGLGIIHRDIKPSNIIIQDRHQMVRIIDFGLAQSTHSRNFAGTKRYSSKSKYNGEKYGSNDDIWAAGCVLLEIALSQQSGELDLPPMGQSFCWCQKNSYEIMSYCMDASETYPGLHHFFPLLLDEELNITAAEILEHPLFHRVSEKPGFYSTNIMVVGKTGDGKSAFLKTVMTELDGDVDVFEDSADAAPHTLTPCSSVAASVKFIDTPGLQDGRGFERDFQNVEAIVQCARNERHLNALIIVMNGSSLRFDISLQETIQLIIGSFRNSLANNLGIVFTRACTMTDVGAIDTLLHEIKIRICSLLCIPAIDVRVWKVECFPEKIFSNPAEVESIRTQTRETIVDIVSWARMLDGVNVMETYAIPSQMLIERKKVTDAHREIEVLMMENLTTERRLHDEMSKLVALKEQRKKDPHNVNEVVQSIVNKTVRDVNREVRVVDRQIKRLFGIKTSKKK
jgi:serine/threonine protein kinase